jgi:uncharacterized membrane protein YcaP (DUF421 family)
MFFASWSALLRVAVVGVLAYAALVVMLRVSGKRTLATMNAFDLVVTVALGSTLATVFLSKDVALAEGLLAFATLVALQFAVAWLSVRSRAVRGFVSSEPTLLLFQGRYLDAALRRERVSREEVRAAVRAAGVASPAEVTAVVLESDGTFSVVLGAGDEAGSLEGVRGVPP